jgi:hypothetical protein
MKKTLIALAALAALSFSAVAEEHPQVAAARDANTAIGACITAMSTGISQSNMASDAKTLMLNDVPAKCRQSVVMPNIQPEVSNASRGWALAQFAIGAFAQYKGQALIWGGLQAMLGRSADSTDNAVNQGFNTANTGISTLGDVTSQTLDKLPSMEGASE